MRVGGTQAGGAQDRHTLSLSAQSTLSARIMMPLWQPESVPLASSDASFSDDGLRKREPSFGSLQELEYVDRWPSEAPPPPSDDEGPRTPRIGPALSLDEDDDDGARVVETVDLTTPPRRREKRITGKARASRVHAVTPPAGPDAVAPFTFCSALNLGDFAAPVAGSPARSVAGSVASSGAATPTRAVTPGTPESPVDEDLRGFRRHRPSPLDASSSEESLVKFEEEASLVGRYLGCSVAARRPCGVRQRRRAAATASCGRRRRSCRGLRRRIWTCGSSDEAWGIRRRRA